MEEIRRVCHVCVLVCVALAVRRYFRGAPGKEIERGVED
jgi:hypothetical protein